jgi:hypothetical protein
MSSSPITETPVTVFECACEEWMRSACKGFEEYEYTGYCVLHYPSRDKSAAFNEALEIKKKNKDFDFRGVWFPDSVDFSQRTVTTPAYFGFATFSSGANFRSATFSVQVYFDSTTFGARADFNSAKFISDADFSSVKFHGEADFFSAEFGAVADFSSAKFGAAAYFFSAKFGAVVSFGSATFREAVSFTSAEFISDASFPSVRFGAEAYFGSAEFGAAAYFNSATFSAKAYFSFAKFRAEAYFDSATFSAVTNFDSATFSTVTSFRFATFKDYVKFAGSGEKKVFDDDSSLNLHFARIEYPDHVTFHTLKLRPYWFVNVDARRFEFINVRVNWRSIKVREEIKSLGTDDALSAHRLLAIACRNLAVNAEENHRYEEASRFRYMAMEARRLESWESWRDFASWTLVWLYWLASGYGEGAWRAFVVLIGVWLVAAALYTWVGFARWEPRMATQQEAAEARRDEVGEPLRWPRALTYSLGVMTLQKPEPRPATNAAQSLVMLETILGPVQAALLALAIRRKFMR